MYFVGVHEVMYQARQGAGNSYDPPGIYLITAAICIVVNMLIVSKGTVLERRTALTS